MTSQKSPRAIRPVTPGPHPGPRVAHVLRQIPGSLAEAHSVGLIHRDVKPSNVILSERGGLSDVARVLDFGLARELGGVEGPPWAQADARARWASQGRALLAARRVEELAAEDTLSRPVGPASAGS